VFFFFFLRSSKGFPSSFPPIFFFFFADGLEGLLSSASRRAFPVPPLMSPPLVYMYLDLPLGGYFGQYAWKTFPFLSTVFCVLRFPTSPMVRIALRNFPLLLLSPLPNPFSCGSLPSESFRRDIYQAREAALRLLPRLFPPPPPPLLSFPSSGGKRWTPRELAAVLSAPPSVFFPLLVMKSQKEGPPCLCAMDCLGAGATPSLDHCRSAPSEERRFSLPPSSHVRFPPFLSFHCVPIVKRSWRVQGHRQSFSLCGHTVLRSLFF